MLKCCLVFLFIFPCAGKEIKEDKQEYRYDDKCKGTCSAGPVGINTDRK